MFIIHIDVPYKADSCEDVILVQLKAQKAVVLLPLLSPSLGMVRMGIWVMEPFLPSTRPARS